MHKSISLKQQFFIFGIPLSFIGLLFLIVKSPEFITNTDIMSIGITIDLLLSIPLVFYFLIRKTSISKTLVVPFIILGMLAGAYILPTENQYYLSLFKRWIFPFIELSVISFVIYNVRKLVKEFRKNKIISFDFFTVLKTVCTQLFPSKLVMPVVTEIAVFYYGFVYWKRRDLNENEFSYHKNSGTIALMLAFILLIIVETYGFHVFLMKWSSTAAWILTFLSIYTGLQVFGFLKSIIKRPISIDNYTINLRYGILSEASIEINNIESIILKTKDIELDGQTHSLSPFGTLEAHNVVIKLKEEETLVGLYGVKKTYKNIIFFVDENVVFNDKIQKLISEIKINEYE